MASNTLGKGARLKHRKQIDALFKTGKTVMAFPYRVYFKEKKSVVATESPVLFGVGVSKRYFKKAVDRNRIKRLTRESYRHHQQAIKELLTAKDAKLDLFFIFTGKELPDLELCDQGVRVGITKLMKLLSTQS